MSATSKYIPNSKRALFEAYYDKIKTSEIVPIFSLNNERIEELAKENKTLTFGQKIQKGIYSGAAMSLKTHIFASVCISLLNSTGYNIEEYDFSSVSFKSSNLSLLIATCFIASVVLPIIEEIGFRGIGQNCLAKTQKFLDYITPSSFKNNRVLNWIKSPACRILAIQSIYAAGHLGNAKVKGFALAAITSVNLLLFSPMSTLHETTGSITAPISAHLTNNIISTAVRLFRGFIGY